MMVEDDILDDLVDCTAPSSIDNDDVGDPEGLLAMDGDESANTERVGSASEASGKGFL